jgi:ubiquinone/menaquinone biosynthesis C-methylase UbiE
MALMVDPARDEIRALRKAVNWRGKHVIEIGCGDGRLTLRLASLWPLKIQALDPDGKLIHGARKNIPEHYANRIDYRVGHAEKLKYPEGTFDIAVFSWVL